MNPVYVLRREGAPRLAEYGGNLQGAPDCLGKMEVDLLPLGGLSSGRGISRTVPGYPQGRKAHPKCVCSFPRTIPVSRG